MASVESQSGSDNALVMQVAHALRQEGKFETAAQYLMHWLQQNKNDSQAWGLLAHCMQDSREYDKAEMAYRRAILNDPTRTDLAIPLAQTLLAQSKNEAAVEVLQLARGSDPENQDLGLFLGIQLAALDRQVESLDCFVSVVVLNAANHVAWAFKSLSHTRLKEYPQALEDAEKSIALHGNFAQAWFAKGRVLQKLGQWQDAAISLSKALELDPANDLAQGLLTSIKIVLAEESGKQKEASQLSQKNLHSLIRQDAQNLRGGSSPKDISYFKLKHDVEQAQTMLEMGLGGKSHEQLLKYCTPLVAGIAYRANQKLQLDARQASALADYWLNFPPVMLEPLAIGCLNQRLDWKAIEQQYLDATPEIVVIDDFLNPEALHAFQRFNLLTPAWTREYPENKYLGAFSSTGYATPLHFQLAGDLRSAMPRIYKDHRLMEFWGFKYDAVIGKGINVHADHALVNLNFWVTPDEYNLDQRSGGLKLYDVPAPPEWSFGEYNSNAQKIYEFLQQKNAKTHSVTYKCNRAVLFNSALFHETDTIHFQDTYRGRRVNMTYLFGEQLGI